MRVQISKHVTPPANRIAELLKCLMNFYFNGLLLVLRVFEILRM